jgi:hypothetical protein
MSTNKTGGSISDILIKIDKLQKTEQLLINQLDAHTSSSGYTNNDPIVRDLVRNINDIANARIILFKSVNSHADILQTGVSQSRTDLVAQATLLQVVEDQLNQAKLRMDELRKRNDTKMRMVQINTYYGQRYEAQSNLMKKIIFVCIPLLIVFVLKKKGIIPEMIANYIVGIMIAVGAFILIRNIWDIYTRNSMDFTEYDWKYEVEDSPPPSIWQFNRDNFFNFDNLFADLLNNLGLCVGKRCCAPGLTYDENRKQCIPDTGSSSSSVANSLAAANMRQGFTSGKGLNGTVVASYFNDDKSAHNGIVPFSYDTDYASYK